MLEGIHEVLRHASRIERQHDQALTLDAREHFQFGGYRRFAPPQTPCKCPIRGRTALVQGGQNGLDVNGGGRCQETEERDVRQGRGVHFAGEATAGSRVGKNERQMLGAGIDDQYRFADAVEGRIRQ